MELRICVSKRLHEVHMDTFLPLSVWKESESSWGTVQGLAGGAGEGLSVLHDNLSAARDSDPEPL